MIRTVLAFLLATGSAAAAEHHYAPEENLEALDVRAIGEAKRSIDMAAYVLTDKAVLAALIAAAERGVVERIALNGDELGASREVEALQRRLFGGRTVTIRINTADHPLMHLKAYVIDGKLLRAGAANFSFDGLRRQDNDLVLDRDASAIAGFARAFGRLWTRLGGGP